MALVLEQVRRCDGACCKESPRFPNEAGDDCRFHSPGAGPDTRGCVLMTGGAEIPDEPSKIFPMRSARRVFQETCVGWPQNTPVDERRLGKTGGCCWQWSDG